MVNRLTQKPELVHKAKPLYAYFHKYESQFGELAQIAMLEKRMAELFPEDPKLAHFNARYSTDKFDPIAARIIVSPTTQLRPKLLMPSIEQATSLQNSPRPPPFATRASPAPPQFLPATNSPKRPFPADDFDEAGNNPPRKIQRNDFGEFQRGASPLKGAAGRRLDQQRRMQAGQGGAASYTAAPAPIARDITFLLGQIPRADLYDFHRFNPLKITNLLRDTHVPEYSVWKNSGAARQGPPPSSSDYSYGGGGGGGGYSRDSPAPGTGVGRPLSPYPSDRGPLPPAPYRQTPIGRPGSAGGGGGGYEPPPPVGYPGAPPPPLPHGFGIPPPTATGQFDAPPPTGGGGGWPPYPGYGQGVPPPGSGRYPY